VVSPPQVSQKKDATNPQEEKPTKKRSKKKKRPTRRVEPKVKEYVVKTDCDVLLGRGGCSNHHSGNEDYRKHIVILQKTYKTLNREEKTQFSKDVLQWVHDRGGRFLKRDEKGSPWYLVTEVTARQKVSQALREDHTPEGRALKKSKSSSSKDD
jgi:hypothetical protein